MFNAIVSTLVHDRKHKYPLVQILVQNYIHDRLYAQTPALTYARLFSPKIPHTWTYICIGIRVSRVLFKLTYTPA